MAQYFYEFFVRGEFEAVGKLGQIREAMVSYVPIAIDDGVAIVGNIGTPRPLTADDPLPVELADNLNIEAFATLNAQRAEITVLRSEIERLQGLLAQSAQSGLDE